MMSDIEESIKLLEKLQIRYFMGKAIPMYERDRSKLRWLFVFLFLVVSGLSQGFTWTTVIFTVLGIVGILIYYSKRIDNYYIRKFVNQNYYNIEKETSEINKKFELATKKGIPNIEIETVLSVLMDGFKVPSDLSTVSTSSSLLNKNFKFQNVVPFSCDSAFQGSVKVHISHGHLVCCIHAFYKDESGVSINLGSYYRYLN